MTTDEARELVLTSIPKDFGKTFDELKKDILKTVEHSSSDHVTKNTGYSVFYTSNPNYMQGTRNGGGAGFFASLRYCGFSKIIKLCE